MKAPWLLVIGLLFSCSSEPRAIRFGEDACHYCKMSIVDPRHCAEAITRKGRVYTFDAVECLALYLKDLNESDFRHLLVADYAHPGSWADARTSSFLISPGIPSPMGANLSAFRDPDDSAAMVRKIGGQTFTWPALVRHFAQNN